MGPACRRRWDAVRRGPEAWAETAPNERDGQTSRRHKARLESLGGCQAAARGGARRASWSKSATITAPQADRLQRNDIDVTLRRQRCARQTRPSPLLPRMRKVSSPFRAIPVLKAVAVGLEPLILVYRSALCACNALPRPLYAARTGPRARSSPLALWPRAQFAIKTLSVPAERGKQAYHAAPVSASILRTACPSSASNCEGGMRRVLLAACETYRDGEATSMAIVPYLVGSRTKGVVQGPQDRVPVQAARPRRHKRHASRGTRPLHAPQQFLLALPKLPVPVRLPAYLQPGCVGMRTDLILIPSSLPRRPPQPRVVGAPPAWAI